MYLTAVYHLPFIMTEIELIFLALSFYRRSGFQSSGIIFWHFCFYTSGAPVSALRPRPLSISFCQKSMGPSLKNQWVPAGVRFEHSTSQYNTCNPLPFLQYSPLIEFCYQFSIGSISNIESPYFDKTYQNTHSQTLMQSLWNWLLLLCFCLCAMLNQKLIMLNIWSLKK